MKSVCKCGHEVGQHSGTQAAAGDAVSRFIRLMLSAALLALGASVQVVGPHPLIVLSIVLCFICMAFPDKAWEFPG